MYVANFISHMVYVRSSVVGTAMLDYIMGDMGTIQALYSSWTVYHILEIIIYFVCFIVQRYQNSLTNFPLTNF